MDYRLGPPHPARNFPMCLQTGLYSNTSHKGSTEGGTVAATKSGSCQGLSFLPKDSATPPIPQGKYLPMTSAHTPGQPTPGMGPSSQPSPPLMTSYSQNFAFLLLWLSVHSGWSHWIKRQWLWNRAGERAFENKSLKRSLEPCADKGLTTPLL